jgi:hypothetical protein
MSSTLVSIVSVLALLYVVSLVVFIVFYAACILGARADRLDTDLQLSDQGIPTDDMLNDMAIEYEETLAEHMLACKQKCMLQVVCPLCGNVLYHAVDVFAYTQLCSLDDAVQTVHHDNDYTTSIVTISKLCSASCIKHATQGCTLVRTMPLVACSTCTYNVDVCKADHLYTICPHMLGAQ